MFTAKNLMAGKISMQGPDGDMGNMEQTAPPGGRVDGGDTGGNQDPWGTGTDTSFQKYWTKYLSSRIESRQYVKYRIHITEFSRID